MSTAIFNSFQIIKQEYEVCEGCLSTNIKLTTLGKHLDLYFSLISTHRVKMKEPLMCLGCYKKLCNVDKFLQQIVSAQKMLKDDIDWDKLQNGHMPFSNLTCVIKTHYDYEMIYETRDHVSESSYASIKYEDDPLNIVDEKSDIDINNVEMKTEVDNDDVVETEVDNDDVVKTEVDNDDVVETEVDNDDVVETEVDNDDVVKTEVDNDDVVKTEIDVEGKMDIDYKSVNVPENIIDSQDKNKKKAVTVKKKERYKKSQGKYNLIILSADELKERSVCFKQVLLNKEELAIKLKKQRSHKSYSRMRYKCEECFIGFQSENKLKSHLDRVHCKSDGVYECDACGRRLLTKSGMAAHCQESHSKYVCLLCGYSCLNRWYINFHMNNRHTKIFECKKCGLRFETQRDIYNHYKHLHERYCCDYCGKSYPRRSSIKKHITKIHMEPICKVCSAKFKDYRSIKQHYNEKHVKAATEESYCVECDIQFDNLTLYKRHLLTSTKHKARKDFPCPVCNKQYTKRFYMESHYKLVHLKRTDYFCDICNKYFLTGYQLRQHKTNVHEKIARPRNKICPYCARGFSTNSIVKNHIRTHTGERPFTCDLCSATFAHRDAIISHIRAIHQYPKPNRTSAYK